MNDVHILVYNTKKQPIKQKKATLIQQKKKTPQCKNGSGTKLSRYCYSTMQQSRLLSLCGIKWLLSIPSIFTRRSSVIDKMSETICGMCVCVVIRHSCHLNMTDDLVHMVLDGAVKQKIAETSRKIQFNEIHLFTLTRLKPTINSERDSSSLSRNGFA